ncbi:hypothetical protein [Bacillus sp. P14.5]|uniref:hypothetical protein n=1 Tax=Bacillus sp. P14.5 TaxID=1983400 RepID=UPI000DE84C99|nr:hypothetical protein [Bacillus sp. P14.5]
MSFFSTGPIDNNLVGGVRQSQQVTVKIVNRSSVDNAVISIRGYFLNGTETLYVLELFPISPNQVITKNYIVNFNYKFEFEISGPAEEETGISVWGKNAIGQTVAVHRIVSDELLRS